MRPRATFRRASVILVLALGPSFASCAHWRQQWVSPEMVVDQVHPERVQVARTDGTRLILENPAVVQDSLVGTNGTGRLAVPLADVDHLSTRHGSTLPAALLLPVGVILGLGAWIAATWD